jgi:tRNA 5-methylaminomethyl-2-thiouridine biosynthesis bifunctional protein
MWSEEVFKGIATLSKPGTTFSTFTVAGIVRRGLEAQGFVVQKIPGHGKKKQILQGYFSCG